MKVCVVRSLPAGVQLQQRRSDRHIKLKLRSSITCQCSAADGVKLVDGIKLFAKKNFVSIALVGGMTAGLLHPLPGKIAQQHGASGWATAGIFLLSGLSLQDGDLAKAREAWPFCLVGMVSILFLTPLAASLVLRLNLNPKEAATALALFCCAPTTLSTGITLTQLAGANSALALALTIASNCLGIFTMPYFVSFFVARGLGITIPIRELLWTLVKTLLVPLVIGKCIRESLRIGELVDRNRQTISMLSSIFLSSVPWMQISCSRNTLLQMNAKNLATCVFLGIGVHLLFLTLNTFLVKLMESEDVHSGRALILVASQKTLPVCLAVVDKVAGQLGEAGLLVVPVVLAHFTQIIIDSMLVDSWKKVS